MTTFIILAHYFEAQSIPLEMADTLEEAEAIAIEHCHGLYCITGQTMAKAADEDGCQGMTDPAAEIQAMREASL